MELLKGALVGGLWGCLVSLVLALLIVVATISVFGGGGGWVSFRNGMILMPIIIGVWIVPISVVKGVDKTYQWGGAKVYHQRGHWPA